ncbi:glycerol-3-phosphate 1-O-acyltransferase PlsY [Commensalibacter sp. M0134]|uniref:glycerol-3-phosphate 1-O-acyltransferase PlsY n=1 Tax=Commensalibacter TaxID=1079922 RepID=UPI0018DB5B67|nr:MULTISPECIES: glycerol-3-phosphate 1-O-acyltransferase PlsY [Commensalibacter]MBI0065789.1 glycerol-3-phosphate 1-O-acyltransferase PlsY [Commensalibacter sp. M0134]MBI0069672.1 glycerol-3-phosphate 1-O-acyltransferase PlsY [Commensalibacter sp. M0133]MBI0080725.1 glycerol-3-phosphate 1-O-acyltransferase PlsY [Commensalibacter melissae]
MIWHIPQYAWTLMAGIIFLSYLIGSIPFGMLVSYIGGMGDIRQIGSGNIGATNVLRTGKKKLAVLTLLLDMGKGSFAIWCAYIFAINYTVQAESLAAIFVVVGHCFPVWINFKGGKGVATGLGVSLALTPIAGLLSCIVWLLAARLSRISSIGGLSAFVAWPLFIMIFNHLDLKTPLLFPALLISLLIFFRHRTNIYRLSNGTEPRIGKKNQKN